MTSWILCSTHVNAALAPASTFYIPLFSNSTQISVEARAQSPAPFTGTWSLLAVEVETNSLSTASTTITARVTGSDVNQTFVISAGVTGNFQDTVNTDNVTQANLMSISIVTASGGTGAVEVCGVGSKYA